MSNDQSGDSKSKVVADAPAPFSGANIGSAMPLQRDVYADHPIAGVATPNAPSGGRDESIPVTQGNQHMLLGASGADAQTDARNDSNAGSDPVVGGPGTDNPAAGLTRTVGSPEGAAAPIRQVGSTVILDEDTRDKDRPEFAPGLPKPRTDPDADPHEKTDPGFQGFDKINPLPLPGAAESVEHRGAVNEPRVVGVQSVGEPPVRVVGSESSEAKLIDGGMSPEAAQAETLNPSAPSDASTASDDNAPKSGKLPEDFPGHGALAAEGVNTYGQLRKRLESGERIPGIGPSTAEKIDEALNE